MIRPLLKVLKDGDIVLMELPQNYSAPIRQIVRLKNLEYESEDEEHPNMNWLNFEGEVLFTTVRVTKESENLIFTNCMGIRELLNPFLVEKYKSDYNMFFPKENQMSEEEMVNYKTEFNV